MKRKLLIGLLVTVSIISFVGLLTKVKAQENQETQEADEGSGLNVFQALAIQQTIESAKNGIELFSDTLDLFVGYTPHVEENKIELKVPTSDGNEVIKTINNADFLRKPFLVISIAILAVLISVRGVQYITSDERDWGSFKGELMNYVWTILLLLAAPLIFFISISITNAFNKELLGEQNLSSFIIEFFEDLEAEVDLDNLEVDADDNKTIGDWIQDIFNWGSKEAVQELPEEMQTQLSVIGYVQAMPYMIPIALMFLFFLFIAFQFIIRFISLYFLTVIYPLIMPFYLIKGTRGFITSYWKVWATTLVHQPAFILGYVLIANLLKSIVTGGATFNSLLIFVGFLIFLTGINVFMGRIVGDAWSALSQTALAGIGTMLGKKAIDTPIDTVRRTADSGKRGLLGGTITDIPSFVGRNVGAKLGIIKSHKLPADERCGIEDIAKAVAGGAVVGQMTKGMANTTKSDGKFGTKFSGKQELKDITKSNFGKELADSGMEIKPIDNGLGVISTTGEMWSPKESDEFGLYPNFASKEQAIKAGYKENELEKVNADKLNFIDTANMKARGRFNGTVTKIVQNKGIQQGKRKNATHFADRAPSADRIKNVFKFAGGNLKSKGIRGVSSKRNINPKGRRSQSQTLAIYTDERLNAVD